MPRRHPKTARLSKRRRWAGGATAALLLIAALQGAGAPQASAAPSCWRDTCSGVDPVEAGCDADAETLQQVDTADSAIEVKLVWSPDCQAVWMKVSRDTNLYTGALYGSLWTTDDFTGGIEWASTTGQLADDEQSAYTPMRSWMDSTTKACWNDQGDRFDPVPLHYEQNGGDASLSPLHGLCTDWM
ncbi:DUF2690 domain-containing protein [Streptomyces sp. NPDC050528]|uniref:DUF2690 domain-containing protein n=1 Tax=unclassified Streptomyces TaxID=2593676 RepID=UPI0037A37875